MKKNGQQLAFRPTAIPREIQRRIARRVVDIRVEACVDMLLDFREVVVAHGQHESGNGGSLFLRQRRRFRLSLRCAIGFFDGDFLSRDLAENFRGFTGQAVEGLLDIILVIVFFVRCH